MRFYFTACVLIAIVTIGNAKTYKMDYPRSGMMTWRSWDTWREDVIELGKEFPFKGDDVVIPPQDLTSNFTLFLQLPTGFDSNKTIEVNSLKIEVEDSVSILSRPDVNYFTIEGDFVKSTKTIKTDSGLKADSAQGNFAMGPNDMNCFLNFKVGKNLVLSDDALDRTSNSIFGGAEYFGIFKIERLLSSFYVAGDVRIKNQNLFISTENGVGALVKGSVIFEDLNKDRRAILIVNSDNSDEAFQLLQTLKVGALKSSSMGDGLITTKTASQKIFENNADSSLISDNKTRCGNIEIVGGGGLYTGEIRDNLSSGDSRGQICVTMNSERGVQYLLGKNTYTGATFVQQGHLVLNASMGLGDIRLNGGMLTLLGTPAKVKKLEFLGGKLAFDMSNFSPIEFCELQFQSGEILSNFEFSNISERKNFTLFKGKNVRKVFASASGKSFYVRDSNTGKEYKASVSVSETSLSVLFSSK